MPGLRLSLTFEPLKYRKLTMSFGVACQFTFTFGFFSCVRSTSAPARRTSRMSCDEYDP